MHETYETRETGSFGRWLKEHRKGLDLTQEELAERIGCSDISIRKIEAGVRRPSKQVAELLADLFNVSVGEEREAFIGFARGKSEAYSRSEEWTIGAKHAHQSAYEATSAQHTPSNLPARLTRLIGRGDVAAELDAHLLQADVRLLTLTGPPGIGKTSLGIHVAASLRPHFREGAFFVALAHVFEPAMVTATIAKLFDLAASGSRPLGEALTQLLADKEMLLLLDNFEQVVEAAPMVVNLLETCPHVKVMITSRQALHVRGERIFAVPPLQLPDSVRGHTVVDLSRSPAVALFVERAQTVAPDFALTEQNAQAVASICVRLEGLPLAIELASARIRTLTPQEIHERLESRLKLLGGSLRDLPARQQTLRNAIDWSYALLSEGEQKLFARLSVFAGGSTLTAIEAICNAKEDLGLEVLDGIDSLVSKNLLKQDDASAGESRFTMLEMIREYASERLAASSEEAKVPRLHAEYYLALAEAANQEWRGSGKQKLWLDRLRHERDNIRSALKWLLDTDRATLALRLAGAMDYFWYTDGQHREGRRWLERALAAANDAPADVRAAALRALGYLAQQEVDYRRSVAPLEESLALYRELGDTAAIAGVLKTLAFSAIRHGDLEHGLALCNEGLALGSDPSLRYEISSLLYTIGAAMWHQGDLARSEEFVTKSLELNREGGNEDLLASGLTALGVLAASRDDYSRAERYYNEGLSIAWRIGDRRAIAQLTTNLAELALSQHDAARAAPLLAEGFGIFVEMNDKEGIAQGLESNAILNHLMEQQERAVRLFAAAAALRKAASIPRPASWGARITCVVSTIHSETGNEAFAKLWEQGQSMNVQEAVAYVLDDKPQD